MLIWFIEIGVFWTKPQSVRSRSRPGGPGLRDLVPQTRRSRSEGSSPLCGRLEVGWPGAFYNMTMELVRGSFKCQMTVSGKWVTWGINPATGSTNAFIRNLFYVFVVLQNLSKFKTLHLRYSQIKRFWFFKRPNRNGSEHRTMWNQDMEKHTSTLL